MSVTAPVEVSLRLEGMRHGMHQQLLAHSQEIDALLEAEIERAFAQFDFTREVQRAIQEVLPGFVQTRIKEMIAAALWDTEIKTLMDRQVRETLARVLRDGDDR
jgi:hypothetical protein